MQGWNSNFVAYGFDPGQSSNPKTTDQLTVEGSPPLPAGQGAAGRIAVAWSERTRGDTSLLEVEPTDVFQSVRTGVQRQQGVGVRRLTPRECERLQGFPDDWTRYDADGNELADSPRYRMMGNAVTVNTVEWIGRRILAASTHKENER